MSNSPVRYQPRDLALRENLSLFRTIAIGMTRGPKPSVSTGGKFLKTKSAHLRSGLPSASELREWINQINRLIPITVDRETQRQHSRKVEQSRADYFEVKRLASIIRDVATGGQIADAQQRLADIIQPKTYSYSYSFMNVHSSVVQDLAHDFSAVLNDVGRLPKFRQVRKAKTEATKFLVANTDALSEERIQDLHEISLRELARLRSRALGRKLIWLEDEYRKIIPNSESLEEAVIDVQMTIVTILGEDNSLKMVREGAKFEASVARHFRPALWNTLDEELWAIAGGDLEPPRPRVASQLSQSGIEISLSPLTQPELGRVSGDRGV